MARFVPTASKPYTREPGLSSAPTASSSSFEVGDSLAILIDVLASVEDFPRSRREHPVARSSYTSNLLKQGLVNLGVSLSPSSLPSQ